MQPSALVTGKVYVPATSPVTVVLVPEPVEVVPPGDLVKVHGSGNPVNSTLPVATVQVG